MADQNSFLSLMNMLNPVGQAALLGYLGYDVLRDGARPVDNPMYNLQQAQPVPQQMTPEEAQYYSLLQQNYPTEDQYYNMIGTQGVRPGYPIGYY